MATIMCACCLVLFGLGLVSNAVRSNQPSAEERAFSAPSMNPVQFLLISSPSEKKISWTTLHNFQSSEGRAFALVDSGLQEPKGIALDHKNGVVYVADTGAKKIFSYKVIVDMSPPTPKIETTGGRLTICQGHAVEWVTLDNEGNLFYTAPDTNNINKIPAKVLDKISKGEFTADKLEVVSEKDIEAQQAVSRQMSAVVTADAMPTDAPPLKPLIFSIYEASANPHVEKPAAVWAEDKDLYWVNAKGGHKAGTIVKGMVNPKAPPAGWGSGPRTFPAVALTKYSAGAYGLAKAKGIMFYTQNGTVKDTGLVSGFLAHNPEGAVDFVKSLAAPRGMVYDGDGTIYVADENQGDVWSFPAGRLMSDVPLAHTVHMDGAYGLAIFSSADPCFHTNSANNMMDNEGLAVATEISKNSGDSTVSFLQKSASMPIQTLNSVLLMLSTIAYSQFARSV